MNTSRRKPRGRSRGGSGGGGGPSRARGDGTSRSEARIEPLHPTLEPPAIESFGEWRLAPGVQQAIAGMGITTPTPIQRLAIQPVLDGRDVIAKAETGTGKTLAFGAPMISKIDTARVSVLGLVLCPTRELAQQVAAALSVLGAPRDVKVALIVGGEPLGPQVEALKSGSQVVVGTPGRVLDLYNQRFLSFPWTEFVVLDEADVMLEIGFIDDIEKILTYMPDERQTMLFSATFPPALLRLARQHTKDPVEVATASGVSTVDNIAQEYMELDDEDRPLALTRLIEQSAPDDVFLIFCERRTAVDRLMRRLERLPFGVKALHGGYDQASRFRVMSAFRTGEVKALVATDVASRGLDVNHVTHVVNYAVPQDITDYTHRIGRTGRAGREGKAISFVVPADRRRWAQIQREATWDIPRVDPPGPSRRGGRGRDRDREREDRDERPSDREERVERRRDGDERPRRSRSRSSSEPEPEPERARRDDEPERPRRERSRRDEPERERTARRDEPERGRRPEQARREDREGHAAGAVPERARRDDGDRPRGGEGRSRGRRGGRGSSEREPEREAGERRPRRDQDGSRDGRPARATGSRERAPRDREDRTERAPREAEAFGARLDDEPRRADRAGRARSAPRDSDRDGASNHREPRPKERDGKRGDGNRQCPDRGPAPGGFGAGI